jgi:hypothetical protein
MITLNFKRGGSTYPVSSAHLPSTESFLDLPATRASAMAGQTRGILLNAPLRTQEKKYRDRDRPIISLNLPRAGPDCQGLQSSCRPPVLEEGRRTGETGRACAALDRPGCRGHGPLGIADLPRWTDGEGSGGATNRLERVPRQRFAGLNPTRASRDDEPGARRGSTTGREGSPYGGREPGGRQRARERARRAAG